MLTDKDLFPPNKTPKILIVDDEPDFLFGISSVLQRTGFNVITASSGNSAIMKARSESPDLIILDINMPKPNGLEVKQILNSDPKTQLIPTIFLTALEDPIFKTCCLTMADDFITKPFDIDVLILRLRSIFRRMDMGYKLGIRNSEKNSMEILNKLKSRHVDLKI